MVHRVYYASHGPKGVHTPPYRVPQGVHTPPYRVPQGGTCLPWSPGWYMPPMVLRVDTSPYRVPQGGYLSLPCTSGCISASHDLRVYTSLPWAGEGGIPGVGKRYPRVVGGGNPGY